MAKHIRPDGRILSDEELANEREQGLWFVASLGMALGAGALCAYLVVVVLFMAGMNPLSSGPLSKMAVVIAALAGLVVGWRFGSKFHKEIWKLIAWAIVGVIGIGILAGLAAWIFS
jgi:FtsH-binding integral membrane protein